MVCVDKQLVADERGGWSWKLLGEIERPNYNTHKSIGYVYEFVEGGGERHDAWGLTL